MSHLVGRSLPSIPLKSTSGDLVNVAVLPGQTVLFCYPYTGRPGVADPPGWDDIPGAHGSTPQSIAYSKTYGEFQRLGINVFGLSLQSSAWQAEFVERTALQVPLLSDEHSLFSTSIRLPMFKAGDQSFIRRITLLIRSGTIIGARTPEQPELDAEQALALVRQHDLDSAWCEPARAVGNAAADGGKCPGHAGPISTQAHRTFKVDGDRALWRYQSAGIRQCGGRCS